MFVCRVFCVEASQVLSRLDSEQQEAQDGFTVADSQSTRSTRTEPSVDSARFAVMFGSVQCRHPMLFIWSNDSKSGSELRSSHVPFRIVCK